MNDKNINTVVRLLLLAIITSLYCIVFNITYEAFLSFSDRGSWFGILTTIILFIATSAYYLSWFGYIYTFEFE